MTNLKVFVLSLALALVVGAGCTRVATKIPTAAIGTNTNPTLDQVTTAIVAGGEDAGWKMETISPGTVKAMKDWGGGKHNIVVDVVYDTSKFDIVYKTSKNLQYDGQWIHNAYNNMTRALQSSIKARTSRL